MSEKCGKAPDLDPRRWKPCHRETGHDGSCAHEIQTDTRLSKSRLCAIVGLAKRVADDYDGWKTGDSEKRMDFEMNMLALQAHTQGIDPKEDLGIDELHVIQNTEDDTVNDEDEI